MGVASLRRKALEAIEAACVPVESVGAGAVLGVYIHREGVAAFRARFASVSPLLDARLESWSSGKVADGEMLEWVRWHTGREQVSLIATAQAVREDLLEMRMRDAAIRGRTYKLAVFGDNELVHRYAALQQVFAPSVKALVKASHNRVTVAAQIRNTPSGTVSLAEIPRITDDVVGGLVVKDVLALMDAMVAGKTELLRNRSRLLLAFKGYDDDSREVWDIPECQEVVRAVAAAAPWWAWIARREEFIVWIASQIQHGKTSILKSGDACLDLDADDANALVEEIAHHLVMLAADCVEAGHDLDEHLRTTVQFARAWVRHMLLTQQQLDAGKLEVATDAEAARHATGSRPGLDALVPDGAGEQATGTAQPHSGDVKHYGMVLDRSPVAARTIAQLRAGPAHIRSRLESASFKAWERGGMPYLVVFGSTNGTGTMIPCDGSPVAIAGAMSMCMQRAKAAGGKCAWTLAVSPTKEPGIRQALASIQRELSKHSDTPAGDQAASH